MEELIDEMKNWSEGSHYEKRAAAAALCEPKLLGKKEQVFRVLQILERITQSISSVTSERI